MKKLSESCEENYDNEDKLSSSVDLLTDCIFSTSLEEKSMIFGNIRQQVENEEDVDVNGKKSEFLFEIKLRYLQRYYRRKDFQMVMRQLVKDREMRYNHKKWKLWIESF